MPNWCVRNSDCLVGADLSGVLNSCRGCTEAFQSKVATATSFQAPGAAHLAVDRKHGVGLQDRALQRDPRQ